MIFQSHISEFRVVPFADRSYVLEYRHRGRWHRVREAHWTKSTDYWLPLIASHPDPLIERGKKFKDNPGSLEAFLAGESKKRDKIIADATAEKVRHQSFSHYI